MKRNSLISALSSTQRQVNNISRIPLYSSGGTFTHSTSQTFTTALGFVLFDTTIRNSGIIWDGQVWTVGASGMYAINMQFDASAGTTIYVFLSYPDSTTNNVAQFTGSGNYQSGNALNLVRYFNEGEQWSFVQDSTVSVNILAKSEGSVRWESPILTIAQLTPKIV